MFDQRVFVASLQPKHLFWHCCGKNAIAHAEPPCFLDDVELRVIRVARTRTPPQFRYPLPAAQKVFQWLSIWSLRSCLQDSLLENIKADSQGRTCSLQLCLYTRKIGELNSILLILLESYPKNARQCPIFPSLYCFRP